MRPSSPSSRPAGFGKTTLLAQWAERDPRPCAWLTLGSIPDHRWPRRPALLVVDDADVLRDDAALEAVAALAEGVPAGSTLALAARSEPRLPLARLRAEGRLLELGPDDLAMTRKEAQTLLRHAGVLLPEPEAAELERRTEGWPAGLYLAALSLRTGGDPWTFSGDDRYVADYLRAEHLTPATPAVRSFLMRTSVLERMSPAICDAVLERTDSAPGGSTRSSGRASSSCRSTAAGARTATAASCATSSAPSSSAGSPSSCRC